MSVFVRRHTAMKQTTKIILHSTSHLLLFGGVILLVAVLWHQNPHSKEPPATPKVTHDEPKTAPKYTVATKPTVTTASVSKKSSPQATLSPKHDEIKNSVQYEYEYRMFQGANDPHYASDWTLAKTNASAAWDISTGNGQTVIAVIDGGFGLAHEDLTNRWFVNSGESGMTQSGGACWTGAAVNKQTNGCDDDGNGYTDDWRGWNFVIGDNSPQAGRQNATGDGTSHGTQVAGLAGAAGNNATGIAAINWHTKIMPLQALDDDGIGYTSDVTAAMYYAVDNGADVINLSLGAYANDPAMRAAVTYASSRGVVVVAASGNCGDGTGEECIGVPAGTIAYPAAYPDVIAVGATTQSDQRAGFSSYGDSLDVVAPGYAIPSSTSWSAANQTSLYSGAIYGTSFASPQVASLAALIKSIRPSTNITDVTAVIAATASKPASMSGLAYTSYYGHGIINAGSALSIASALNSVNATPTLLQAGSYQSEHTAPFNSTLASGCQATSGSPCSIELTAASGHKRYLPYMLTAAGSAGWTWSANVLDSGEWAARARVGERVSSTPYYLGRK